MKRFLTFIFLAALLSLSEQTLDSISNASKEVIVNGNISAPRSPPDDFIHFPGVGYYKFVDQGMTFENAQINCENAGAHLAIINSLEEACALASIYRPHYSPGGSWPRLGFGDFYEKGDFRTLFGEHISTTGYSYWYPGEPGTPFERNCGCMNIEGQMGTHCCDCNRYSICEIEES